MTPPHFVVVGLGYIGLPTAAVLARAGCLVTGVDVREDIVRTINDRRIHIVEPGLEEVVATTVDAGRLRASLEPVPADAFLIAVPTPFDAQRAPDLRHVRSACEAIAPVLAAGNVVILESTSPVGATEQVAGWLAAARPDLRFPADGGDEADVAIAYCPERVLPGRVLEELIANDRVIGGLTPACADKAREVYRTFVQGECVLTDARTAEMCKLTENAFRDVNIAFANELSLICDRLDINVWRLIALANRHPRVNILQPGPGVGGHCIACDPWFIVASAPEEAKLIATARAVNDGKPDWVLGRIDAAIASFGSDRKPVVACYGLAFKPDIDDLRDSPALAISRSLAESARCDILVVEPHIGTLPAGFEQARLVTADEAVAIADIHVLLVDHTAFRTLPVPAGLRIDTRGIGW